MSGSGNSKIWSEIIGKIWSAIIQGHNCDSLMIGFSLQKSQAQASVSQARKTARRLIRPRIEPEVVTELGDSTAEGSADVTETEMEPEEGKLAVAAASDTVEAVSTAALTVQMTGASAPATDSTVPPSVTVSITTEKAQSVSSLRKRPASVASEPVLLTEEVPPELVKSESAPPPQKRPRPVEQSPEEAPQQSSPAPPSLTAALVGVNPQGDVVVSHDVAQDDKFVQEVAVSDITNIPSTSQEAVIASDAERERPASEISDVPPQKRPRFIRPEALLLSQQAMVKDEGVPSEDAAQEDKMVVEADDIVQETDLTREAKGGEAETTAQGSSFPSENPAQEQKVDVADVPSSREPTLGGGGEPQASPAVLLSVGGGNVEEDSLAPVAGILSAAEAIDLLRNGSEIFVNEVLAEPSVLEAETQVPFGGGQFEAGAELMDVVVPQVVELDVPLGDSGAQRDSVMAVDASGTTEEVQEVEEEPEEGEIPIEPFTLLESSRGDNVEVVLELERPPDLNEEATPPVEIQEVAAGGDSGSLATEAKTTAVSEVINAPAPADTGVQEQTEAGESAQGESGSMVTRHSVRSTSASSNTTIHLAERARERAALRRGGTNPQSPAARGRGRAARAGKVCRSLPSTHPALPLRSKMGFYGS